MDTPGAPQAPQTATQALQTAAQRCWYYCVRSNTIAPGSCIVCASWAEAVEIAQGMLKMNPGQGCRLSCSKMDVSEYDGLEDWEGFEVDTE